MAVSNPAEQYKLERIATALNEENWNDYLFAHDDPDRPSALVEIAERLNDVEYWKLLRLIWTHGDELWRNNDAWRELFTSKRPSREEIMEPEERAELAELDDPVLIFRGHTEHNLNGWSWTRTWSSAKEFAKTPMGWPANGTPKVTMARVKKVEVIAYLTLLDEQELVIDPETAYDHETVTVNPGE